MRRAFFVALALVVALAGSVSAQSTKGFRRSVLSRLDALESEISELRKAEKMGANSYVLDDIENQASGGVPSSGASVKTSIGLVQLVACDTLTGWDVASGSTTLSLDTADAFEGTGSIKFTLAAQGTAIIRFTGGPWDLSAMKYLRATSKRSDGIITAFGMYFGESTYTEQSHPGGGYAPKPEWSADRPWDISAIAAASRNAVTVLAFKVKNNLPAGGSAMDFWIDDVKADNGAFSATVGNGVTDFLTIPKFIQGTYTGTASTAEPQTITLTNQGEPVDKTPSAVFTVGDVGTNGHAYLWLATMGTKAKDLSGVGALDPNVIPEVGAGYFKAQGNNGNKNGVTYHYFALFAD